MYAFSNSLSVVCLYFQASYLTPTKTSFCPFGTCRMANQWFNRYKRELLNRNETSATSCPDHISQCHHPTCSFRSLVWTPSLAGPGSFLFTQARPRTLPCPIQPGGQCSHADSQFQPHPLLYPLQMNPCRSELPLDAAAHFLSSSVIWNKPSFSPYLSSGLTSQIRHKHTTGNFSSPCTCPHSASAPTFDLPSI